LDGLTTPQKEEAGQLAEALRGLSVDASAQDVENTLAAVHGWVPSVTRIKDLETKVRTTTPSFFGIKENE